MGIFFFSHTLELYLNKTKDSQIQIFNQNQGFYLICKLNVQNDFFSPKKHTNLPFHCYNGRKPD